MKIPSKKLILIFACLLIAVFSLFLFCACDLSFSLETPSYSAGDTPKATSFVRMDSTSSIEFVLDQKDRVMSVNGVNDEGVLLLWQESGIQGYDIGFAVKKLTVLAQKYGFITGDNHSIYLSIVSIDEDHQQRLNDKILASADEIDDINILFINNYNFVCERYLASLQQDCPALDNISTDHFYLMTRLVAHDNSLSIEDVATLSIEQLLARINAYLSDQNAKFGIDYQQKVYDASYTYDSAYAQLLDSVRVDYYTEKALSAKGFRQAYDYAIKCVLSAKYRALHTIEIALSYYSKLLSSINTVYSIDNVDVICSALSDYTDMSYQDILSFVTDKAGAFDINAFCHLVNMLYANLDDDVDVLNAFTIAVENINLSCVQDDSLSIGVKKIIDNALVDLNNLPSFVKYLVPDSIFDIALDDIDYLSTMSIENALNELSISMQSTLDSIRESESDTTNILNAQQDLQEDIDALKEKLELCIANAKERATQYLDEKKASLLA